jgi:aryl-alcohol dehydrogenase-like predicted oxidoreductase
LPNIIDSLLNSDSRIVLGTAQLGSHYGIANQGGNPEQKKMTEIIQEAWDNGIYEFDTAQGYGESEKFLGRALTALGINDKVKLISKFHPTLDHLNQKKMREALEASLGLLKVPFVSGMMVHNENILKHWEEGIDDAILGFKQDGLIQQVGVSVYSPEMAFKAVNTESIDLIQMPTNIWDRRFEKTGIFEIAKAKGKQIYIRNVFLQGLILMAQDRLPDGMDFAIPTLDLLDEVCEEYSLTRQEVSLGYMKISSSTSKLVIGVNETGQIKKNIVSWQKNYPNSLIQRIQEVFKSVSDDLVQPLSWPKKFW